MNLKETRERYRITQEEASKVVQMPIRTYRRYESDDTYGNFHKRQSILLLLNKEYEITEDKGLLTIDEIKSIVNELFDISYPNQIDFCFLFGSYAKGTATPSSDIDLYINSSLTGLNLIGLIESLRQRLHKKIDVIRPSELVNNISLANEIMKTGVKIYDK